MTCPEAKNSSVAAAYAACLLSGLGRPASDLAPDRRIDVSPATAWARSGAMALTGTVDGPALAVDAPIAACADGAARALTALARATTGRAPEDLDGAALLGERAALADPPLQRSGTQSAGGSCRLIRCVDGWMALNLARPEDVGLVPAWLELDGTSSQALADPAAPVRWPRIEGACRERGLEVLVSRGRLMGMAVSPVPPEPGGPAAERSWLHIEARGSSGRARRNPPLVLDLSSLWAGPLCGQLLADCGARVVKVESTERPDGARRGEPAFFDLMNGGKESIALPFREARGRRVLGELLARADVVIESSRRRALEQLGIFAEQYVEEHGVSWIAITGHGRTEPEAAWVAFGDDAAAAAGLVARTGDGTPLFCGDAIADPLTGLHAAVAAFGALLSGGSQLVDLSLRRVSAHVLCFGEATSGGADPEEPARSPRARPIKREAPALGSDTARILDELGIEC
jgi:crotonobetainyl-CoA:carnitine CoA-transferase CaiB-like acyl-CoA transferase